MQAPAVINVSPFDTNLVYMGAWYSYGPGRLTIYAGSQLRVKLQGTATLMIEESASVNGYPTLLKVRELGANGGITYDSTTPIVLNSTSQPCEFEIVYQAHMDSVFDPTASNFDGSRLGIEGIELADGSVLYPATSAQSGWRLDFLGDSITQGDRILQGYGNNLDAMDGSLSFAYLLAQRMQAAYRIRGYGGESITHLDDKVPFFFQSVPLEPMSPAHVQIVNIGANDQTRSDESYQAAMESLLSAITNEFPLSSILVLNFFRNDPNRNAAIQAAISHTAPARAVFFDAQPYVSDFADSLGHPDRKSHAALAAALELYLRTSPVVLLDTATVGQGTVNVADRLYCAGSSAMITATASAHYHFTQWTGQTNDCTISGNRITAPMTVPRAITANFAIDRHSLAVTTPYGSASPAAGTNWYNYYSAVKATVSPSPVTSGSTQYICRGWNETGSVPGSGTTTNTSQFRITQNSTITWNWRTNYWLDTGSSAGGGVSVADGWFGAGSNVQITAIPSAHQHFTQWSGQTNGFVVNGNTITVTMDGPLAVTANFEPDPRSLMLAVTNPTTDSIWAIADGIDIGWSGVVALGEVDIELWHGTKFMGVLAQDLAAPEAQMQAHTNLPAVLPSADDYWVLVTDVDNPAENAYSDFFAISVPTILLQNTNGVAGRWFLAPDDKPALWQQISSSGTGFLLRDMADNRVLLQQGDGGRSGIWTLDDNATPVLWQPVSDPLPGWIMRSLDGNRVLLQQGDGGRSGIWTLDDNATPVLWQPVSDPLPGWIMRSLDGNRVLLQQGDGGRSGIWTLSPAGTPETWSAVSDPLPGWITRSLDGNCVLLQEGDGGRSGIWTLSPAGTPETWTAVSDPTPGWIIKALDSR